MAISEITTTGPETLNVATELLQRARLAHPTTGLWEAADIQWSARVARESDNLEQTFWIDEFGPCACILVTSSAQGAWQLDPILVPNQSTIDEGTFWKSVLDTLTRYSNKSFIVPISDDDTTFQHFANSSGMEPEEKDFTGWLSADIAPEVSPVAGGFTIKDRSELASTTHPMADRNGHEVGERLEKCSLYDPTLELCVQTESGDIAGYSLYWFDPVTRVGLIEPVRIHDTFQRKGLARAMVSEGINRLIDRGAERIKVSWETEAAGALYQSVGIQLQSTTTWFFSSSN